MTVLQVKKNNDILIDTYFDKYNKLIRKIKSNEYELETIEVVVHGGISGHSTDNISSSNNVAGIDEKLSKIEKLKAKIGKLYVKQELLRKEYLKTLNKLSRFEYEIILTSFYLDKLSLKEISIRLNKSIAFVKKNKREAMDELLIIIAN